MSWINSLKGLPSTSAHLGLLKEIIFSPPVENSKHKLSLQYSHKAILFTEQRERKKKIKSPWAATLFWSMKEDTLLISGFPFKVSFTSTSMASGKKSPNNCLLEALANILHTSETQEEAKKSVITSLNYAWIHLNILGFWATWSFSYMVSHRSFLVWAKR